MTDYERTTVRTDDVEDTTVARPASYTRSEREVVRSSPGPAQVARRLVALLFGILQALLVLRIILLLLIANRDNQLVAWILDVTDYFVEPFRGMFALDSVRGSQGSVLDVAAGVALIGWTLIEALVLAVLSLGSGRSAETV